MEKENKTHWQEILSRFVVLSKPDFRCFAVALALLLLASLLEGISLGLLIPLLDILINKGNIGILVNNPFLAWIVEWLPEARFRYVFFALLSGVLAAIFLKSVFVFTSDLMTSRISRDVEHRLRTRIYDRYLSFGKQFYDNHKIGHLYDLATSQVLITSEFFRFGHHLLMNLCMGLVYLCMMIWVSWSLTLAALLMLPFIYLAIRLISKKISLSTQQRFESDQRLSAYLYDALSNMALIRFYTNEPSESKIYEKISRTSRDHLYSIWKKIIFAPHFQELVLSFFTAALITACFFIFLKGTLLSTAVFLSFFILLRRFSQSINQSGSCVAEIAKTVAGMKAILWIFEDADKEFIPNGKDVFLGLRKAIRFDNVSFGYQGAGSPILKGLNLEFVKGKMTALVGPSGAGKTTIINLVNRFYDVSTGVISYDGVNIRNLDIASLRKKIAVVDQEVAILNTTLRNNIVYGIHEPVADERLIEVAKKAYIYDTVVSLPDKFDTIVGDKGVKLSGGEKQRVAIARAFLKDPEIFIFDEATSFLDMETERLIQKAIENLAEGRTVIVVAHRLPTIKKADYIYVIENGQVAEEGNVKELLQRSGRFRFYWDLQ